MRDDSDSYTDEADMQAAALLSLYSGHSLSPITPVNSHDTSSDYSSSEESDEESADSGISQNSRSSSTGDRSSPSEADTSGPPSRKEEALKWYNKLAQPTRETMYRIVDQESQKLGQSNITKEDVDLLRWNKDSTRVSPQDDPKLEASRKKKATKWYLSLAKPTHATMTKCIEKTQGMDISVADVDLLNWNKDKTKARKEDNARMEEAQRKEKAYEWYQSLAEPNRKVFAKIIEESSGIGIERQDIDLLPWNPTNTKVLEDNKGQVEPSAVTVNNVERKSSAEEHRSSNIVKSSVQLKKQSRARDAEKTIDPLRNKREENKLANSDTSTLAHHGMTKEKKDPRREEIQRKIAEEKLEERREAEARAIAIEKSRVRKTSEGNNSNKAKEFEDSDQERRENDRATRMRELRRSVSLHMNSGKQVKEEEHKPRPKRVLSPEEQKEKERREFLMSIYSWWGRLGQPTRDDFKRRIAEVTKSGVSPDDIDELPWSFDGGTVMVNRMNKLINAGYIK